MEHIDTSFFRIVERIYTKIKKKRKENILETKDVEIIGIIKEYKLNDRINDFLMKYVHYYMYSIYLLNVKSKNDLINKSINFQKQFPKIITPYFIKVISEVHQSSNNDKQVDIVEVLYSKFYLFQDKRSIYQIYDELEDKSVKKQITIITDNYLKKNIVSDATITERLNGLLNNSEKDPTVFINPEIFFNLILKNQNEYSSPPEEPLDILINNTIIIPVTKDFNRLHKQESNKKQNISKKNNKATMIFEQIKEATEEKDVFLKHVKNYSIYYNKVEEIHVLNKFQTYDGIFIKNIENKNTYLELQKISKTRYFNFKNLTFPYVTKKKNMSFRLFKTGEIDISYRNIRNLQAGENIDIAGFVITNDIDKMINTKNQNPTSLIGYLKNKDLIKKKINRSLKKNLFYKINTKEVNNEINGLMVLLKSFINQKVVREKSVNCKKSILEKYSFLFNKQEHNLLLLEIAKSDVSVSPLNQPVFRHKKSVSEKKIQVFNIEKNKEIKTFYIFMKTYKTINSVNDKKTFDFKCPHNIEFDYLESRKNDVDFNYNFYLKKINIEYGVYDEILGTICKKCFGVLDSSNVFVDEKDGYFYNGKDFFLSSDFEKYEEDIKYFEEYIFEKFFSVLSIQSFNKERSDFKIVINNLIELISFHNSLCKIMDSKKIKSNINEIQDFKNLFVKSDDNQREIVLYYVNITFIYVLTHNEVLRLFFLDSHCNLNVYKKYISPFLKKIFHQEKTYLNESLMFLVFIISCFNVKYILKTKVSDKKIFNEKLKRIMINTILILKTILTTNNFSNKNMELIKRILLLKVQNIYNQNLYVIGLKTNSSENTKNDQSKDIPQYSLDNKLLKTFSYLKNSLDSSLSLKNNHHVLKTKKSKYENNIHEKTLKGKIPNIRENNKFYRSSYANGEEKVVEDKKYYYEYTNVSGESMNQFIKTFSLTTSEDSFFIDYDINGKKYTEGKKIGKNNIFVVELKKGYKIFSIYMTSLKCYMYFDKNMLFYIGYSLTKDSNIKYYEKKTFFLRVESSIQNKLRYLGYPSMYYSFDNDKNIKKEVEQLYFSVNENIKKIAFDLHIMFNFLSRKQSDLGFLLTSEKSKKIIKFVSAITENDNFQLVYKNEFNFKVMHSNYKLDIQLLDKKKEIKGNVYTINDLLEGNSYSNIYTQYILSGFISIYNNNKKEMVKSLLLSVLDVFHDKYMETDTFKNVLSNFITDNYNLSNIIDFNNKQESDGDSIKSSNTIINENDTEGGDEVDVDMNTEDYDEDEGVNFYHTDE